MSKIKVLQCGYSKSGNYLLYKTVSELMRKCDAFSSLTSGSGLSAVIEALCSEYIQFAEIKELDYLRVVGDKFYLSFPHPKCKLLPISLDLLLDQSSLIWIHEPPSMVLDDRFREITHRLYIMRDGRDVVNSLIYYVTSPVMLRLCPEYKYDSSSELYNNLEYFEKCVLEWVKHVRDYMKIKDRFYPVRFEELVHNKPVVVKGLAEYLGLHITTDDIDSIIHMTSINK
ncbi:MAG TPA: hypothetical protein ENG80_00145 [Nitrospirae bacterium]|nr:hypothetical protein [Nitrospirota bacterium]HDH06710.1 hypothetical protein [Nitrospirota bacterium]